jgi:toxin-antitoxin system PIN domain toxin
MFLVDTNLLVYAANRDAEEHVTCKPLLEQWITAPTPWHLSWGIIYEFIRVVTHPRVLTEPWNTTEAWAFVQALLNSPSLEILTETERHAQVASDVLRHCKGLTGNLIHDAHIAILMKEHGLKTIYTHDTHFHLFPFLQVIDPLR